MTVMHCTLFTIHDKNTAWIGFNFDWTGDGGKIWFIPPAGGRHIRLADELTLEPHCHDVRDL